MSARWLLQALAAHVRALIEGGQGAELERDVEAALAAYRQKQWEPLGEALGKVGRQRNMAVRFADLPSPVAR